MPQDMRLNPRYSLIFILMCYLFPNSPFSLLAGLTQHKKSCARDTQIHTDKENSRTKQAAVLAQQVLFDRRVQDAVDARMAQFKEVQAPVRPPIQPVSGIVWKNLVEHGEKAEERTQRFALELVEKVMSRMTKTEIAPPAVIPSGFVMSNDQVFDLLKHK